MQFWNKVKRRSFYRANGKKLREQVLFVSFGGSQVSDSPLDISLELQKAKPGLKLIWAVKNVDQSVPAGIKKVIVGSATWFTALSKSRYIVTNNNLPMYFRKAPGQIYLQTWHGTPLKRIGNDILENKLSTAYNNAMAREGKYWDYLISPNAFSTEIFPRAFGFAGRVLEIGYPRNDRLINSGDAERTQIRRKLGIVDPKTPVVLYAPTWRDYSKDAGGKWASVNNLDVSKLPKGVRVVYRGHSNTSGSERVLGENVIDATTYPDVTELYLAADVLITDYSSVMFDFSVTGKPILFLCPDLAEYVSTRGFYFDFASLAPGPILGSSGEVAKALSDLPAVTKKYAKKYAEWRQKFNNLEDGKASSRVVATVFHA